MDLTESLLGRVPNDVLSICKRLRERGKRAWIVGGSVRDLVRGGEASDWDIATDALPEEVVKTFRRVIPTGIDHGTVTVLVAHTPYEVTTLRGESVYSDGRRPDAVTYVTEIEDDLGRRDFTINAIALDPLSGKLIDPFGGQADLKAGTVRAVGVAEDRFAEDGLRVLRAARFAATLDFSVEPETHRAMSSHRALQTFRRVSAERIRDEWLKTMKAARPSTAFELMRQTSLLDIICPEMLPMVGCEQNQWHAFDVWHHSLACLDACPRDPIMRMAGLLHDIGKPRSRAFSDKTADYTFYEHERIGAEMVGPILARLRFSNAERERVTEIVRHHLICYSDDWTDAAVRRWLRRVGPNRAEDLYAIGIADALGKGRDASNDVDAIHRLRSRVEDLIRQGAALSSKDLAIKGGDLIQELALPRGPLIGQVIEHLVELITDAPELNEREKLVALARDFVAARE